MSGGCRNRINKTHVDRTKRLFEIYELILSKPHKWTCGKLGLHFNVSRTQIFRDIERLREIGKAIKSSKNGFFFIPKPESVPPHGE
jgi:predicted DNA-binding transcriptional regulator YafY